MADTSGKIQASRSIHVYDVILLVMLLLTGFSLLRFPHRVAGVGLDDSWQKAYGFFFKNHLQAGKEYVFTYGPLGFFCTSVYDRDLFWTRFFFELISNLILLYYFARIIKIKVSPPGISYLVTRFLAFLLLLFFLGSSHRDTTSLFFAVMIGIILMETNISWADRIFGFVLLAVLSLEKFVLFGFTVVVVLIAEFCFRKVHIKRIVSPLPCFVVIFCLVWIFSAQSIWNLPTYLISSMQIATGYNDAMASQGKPFETNLSIVILGISFLLLLQLYLQRKGDRADRFKVLILAASLILAWKQGFTRQDNHTVIFFCFALVAALILLLHFQDIQIQTSWRILRIFGILCVILGSITGFFNSTWGEVYHIYGVRTLLTSCSSRIRQNVRFTIAPAKIKESLEFQERQLEKEWELPVFRSRIQNSTVDLISFQQGYLLFNHMNWHPRPVFQGYSSYTPYLLERDSRFFRSAIAPDYLLYNLQTIDDRFPTLDDSLALFEILWRYIPDAAENSFLLLKKNPSAPKEIPERQFIKTEEISFDQEVRLPRDFRYQILSLQIRETLLGKMRKLIYKPTAIFIKIKTKSKIEATYRLIPGSAKKGFLLTPFVRKTSDINGLYGGLGGSAVQSFTILTDSPGRWFRNSIKMELRGTDLLVPQLVDRNRLFMIGSALDSDSSFDGKQAAKILELTGGEPYQEDWRVLYGNSSLDAKPQLLPAGSYRVVVVGYGSEAGKEFPKMNLLLNNAQIASFDLSENRKYEFPFQITKQEAVVFSLQFINDAVIGSQDRNVFIKSIYVVPDIKK